MIGIVFNDFYQSFAIVLSRHRPNSGLMHNGKVRIPLGSFQIESEGSGKFPELVPIKFTAYFLKKFFNFKQYIYELHYTYEYACICNK